MEKMDKEVKGAVKELLEKIPEDKLSEAVGGLDTSVKNILICLGLVGFSALSGAGGFYVGQKSDREYNGSKIAKEIIELQRKRMLTQLNEIEEKTIKAQSALAAKLLELTEVSKKLAQQVGVKTPESTE